MKSTNLFHSLVLIVALSACGGPPSASDGRKQLETKIESESSGLIKLVSFEKTNGVQQEIMGMQLYLMDYAAEIEFLDNCMWGGGELFGWDGSFNAVRGQPSGGLDSFNPRYFGKQKGTKGQRHKVSGKFQFTKTEKGWITQ